MKTVGSLAVSLVLAGTAAAVAPSAGFDRYQIILNRKPFGAAGDVSAAATNAAAKSASEISFVKGLRLTFLGDLPSGLRVGLVSAAQTNQSFFLSVGEKSEDGIELVAVNYAAEEATLRRGAEMAVLKLTATPTNAPAVAIAAPPMPPAPTAPPPPPDPSARRSFWDRRRGGGTNEAGFGPPRMGAERMEQRLQEYQMRAIRGGMPPLPVPLTPENDAQLVSEGVLPPQN